MDIHDKIRILELMGRANVAGFLEGRFDMRGMIRESQSQQENYLENRREVKRILGLSDD